MKTYKEVYKEYIENCKEIKKYIDKIHEDKKLRKYHYEFGHIDTKNPVQKNHEIKMSIIGVYLSNECIKSHNAIINELAEKSKEYKKKLKKLSGNEY